MWDAVLATLKPSGSVYRDEPVVSMRLDEQVLAECRDSPGCITPLLSGSQDLVQAVREAIGTDEVTIRRSYGNPLLPWEKDTAKRQMSVQDLLGKIGEEGWPGYDFFLDGVVVHEGTARFGRPVYSISPTSQDKMVGELEVYPLIQATQTEIP